MDLLVKGVDFEVQRIRHLEQIDLASLGVYNLDLLSAFECDARLVERRGNATGRLVVDQVTLNYRAPVAVAVNRMPDTSAGSMSWTITPIETSPWSMFICSR